VRGDEDDQLGAVVRKGLGAKQAADIGYLGEQRQALARVVFFFPDQAGKDDGFVGFDRYGALSTSLLDGWGVDTGAFRGNCVTDFLADLHGDLPTRIDTRVTVSRTPVSVYCTVLITPRVVPEPTGLTDRGNLVANLNLGRLVVCHGNVRRGNDFELGIPSEGIEDGADIVRSVHPGVGKTGNERSNPRCADIKLARDA